MDLHHVTPQFMKASALPPAVVADEKLPHVVHERHVIADAAGLSEDAGAERALDVLVGNAELPLVKAFGRSVLFRPVRAELTQTAERVLASSALELLDSMDQHAVKLQVLGGLEDLRAEFALEGCEVEGSAREHLPNFLLDVLRLAGRFIPFRLMYLRVEFQSDGPLEGARAVSAAENLRLALHLRLFDGLVDPPVEP